MKRKHYRASYKLRIPSKYKDIRPVSRSNTSKCVFCCNVFRRSSNRQRYCRKHSCEKILNSKAIKGLKRKIIKGRLEFLKKCQYCKKEFWTKIPLSQKYCSHKCYKRYNSSGDYDVKEEGFYVKGKESYQNKIIDYPESPSGKAYVGINKTPLMPNKSGYGFQGVLIQDDSRQYMQCAECGDWFKKLSTKHLKKCSGLTGREYKEKYGLYYGQGLVSDETSHNLARQVIINKERLTHMTKISRDAASKRYKETTVSDAAIKRSKTMAWQNAYGTCPEQTRAKLKEFILCNREFPNAHNRGGAIYKAVMRRFGKWNKAMKEYGLPSRTRIGTNYKFVFPDFTTYRFNINKNDERDELFQMMKLKCNFLT